MIKSLEGGRGLAALIVALYHLRIGIDHFSLIRNGYLFVDLFFVLSGFVMCAAYGSTLRTTGDFRSFLIRRIGRLYPLLIFSTLVFILAENAIIFAKHMAFAYGYGHLLNNPGNLEYAIPTAAEILATITLTHGMGLFDRLILNTPSWSISTEFYTYFLFAAICLALTVRQRIASFILLSIVGCVISVWASSTVHACLTEKGCLSLTNDFGFLRCIYSFFLGTLVFYISQRVRIGAGVLQAAGMLSLTLLLAYVDTVYWLGFLFPLSFALLILAVCTDKGWLSSLLKWQPLQVLGLRSYSIYLLHMPLVLFFENVAKRVNGALPSLIVVILYVAVLLVISGWSYRFIEDPLRKRFNRLASAPGGEFRWKHFFSLKKTAD